MIKIVDIQKELDGIKREIRVAMKYCERLSNELINSFIDNFYGVKTPDGIINKIVGFVKSKRKN